MTSSAFMTMFKLFVLLPLWFYMLYRVLTTVAADELTWFIFWLYLPAGFIGAVLGGIVEWGQQKKKAA